MCVGVWVCEGDGRRLGKYLQGSPLKQDVCLPSNMSKYVQLCGNIMFKYVQYCPNMWFKYVQICGTETGMGISDAPIYIGP